MYWRYECDIWDEEDPIFIRIFGEKKIGFGATLFLAQLHQHLKGKIGNYTENRSEKHGPTETSAQQSENES